MQLSEVVACFQGVPEDNPDVHELALLLADRFDDQEELEHWLGNENRTLKGVPAEMIKTNRGLSRVIGFVMMSGNGFF
jgi:hypothetical protein